MFEFRWIQLGSKDFPPVYAIPVEAKCGWNYRVLQVRQAQNTLEVSNEIRPAIWGEWEDIPMKFQPKLKEEKS